MERAADGGQQAFEPFLVGRAFDGSEGLLEVDESHGVSFPPPPNAKALASSTVANSCSARS